MTRVSYYWLTTIQNPETKFQDFVYLCANQDSNLGPLEYQSSALPAELFAHMYSKQLTGYTFTNVQTYYHKTEHKKSQGYQTLALRDTRYVPFTRLLHAVRKT